jgi:hypothetical protein
MIGMPAQASLRSLRKLGCERGHDGKWKCRREGGLLFENRIDIQGAGAPHIAAESKSERRLIH